jgi:hypothetical protein
LKERNTTIFERKESVPMHVLQKIKKEASWWEMAGARGGSKGGWGAPAPLQLVRQWKYGEGDGEERWRKEEKWREREEKEETSLS